ncbi:MAG: hypothetical protein GF383_16095 [Candidatus Lokiarchaeota archaeon]|nr:hypothetical protein [Candidatus Lokiarchaeota archaeon]MBD3343253.1 hypothetical protein [Candidatus Lokiarchaeota archaeon]
MDIDEIEEKIRKYRPLNETISKACSVGRYLIDTYFSEVPYSKKRKRWEIEFFYNNIEFITRKWVMEIIWELETHKGLNFNELKRNIKKISARALSDRLKELEESDIISRTVQDTRPPTVLYQLSEKGKGFIELMIVVILFLKNMY